MIRTTNLGKQYNGKRDLVIKDQSKMVEDCIHFRTCTKSISKCNDKCDRYENKRRKDKDENG